MYLILEFGQKFPSEVFFNIEFWFVDKTWYEISKFTNICKNIKSQLICMLIGKGTEWTIKSSLKTYRHLHADFILFNDRHKLIGFTVCIRFKSLISLFFKDISYISENLRLNWSLASCSSVRKAIPSPINLWHAKQKDPQRTVYMSWLVFC